MNIPDINPPRCRACNNAPVISSKDGTGLYVIFCSRCESVLDIAAVPMAEAIENWKRRQEVKP